MPILRMGRISLSRNSSVHKISLSCIEAMIARPLSFVNRKFLIRDKFCKRISTSSLPTERLEAFLEQYYTGQLQEDFSAMIPYLEYVLGKRKTDKQ